MINKAKLPHTHTPTARIRSLHPSRTNKIGIRLSHGIECITVDDIICCEAWGNYCRIHLSTRPEPILVSKTLKHVSGVLPEAGFYRPHQSFVIRLDAIASVSDEIHLSNGMKVPLSRRQKPDFMSWLKHHITLI
ncbi:MAG: LytTR family DNA-binding domain-containing protein [Saprospiraceae bacterium]|nr:LytTR family DNA-binding domain-containing protein [Saprospiraceae bacterium]